TEEGVADMRVVVIHERDRRAPLRGTLDGDLVGCIRAQELHETCGYLSQVLGAPASGRQVARRNRLQLDPWIPRDRDLVDIAQRNAAHFETALDCHRGKD